MTHLLGFILAIGLTPAGPKQKVFIDSSSGYKFIYPADWSIKETKVKTVFTIPLGTNRKAANLEIMDIKFGGDREVWQELQATTTRDTGRNLEKQWDEEFLGVPLLMTRTSREDSPTTLVGLLYSRQDRKFWFKLSSKPSEFDAVEKLWRESLLTLTPVSGDLPKTEEPDRPDTTDPKKKPKPPKRTTTVVPLDQDPDKPKPVTVFRPDSAPTAPKPPKGSVSIATTAGGRNVTLFLPSSIKNSGTAGLFTLDAPGLKGNLTIEALSILDSGTPDQKLVKAFGATLDDYSKVESRNEAKAWRNEAGAKVTVVSRKGQTSAGSRWETFAVGESVDFYWLVRYTASSSEIEIADRSILRLVMEKAAVRLAP